MNHMFCGFYLCVNYSESGITNKLKVRPEDYIQFVSDLPEFTHR